MMILTEATSEEASRQLHLCGKKEVDIINVIQHLTLLSALILEIHLILLSVILHML